MIVGNTASLSYLISLTRTFTVSNLSIQITNPDGTVSAANNVSVSPGTLGNQQTLNYFYTPTQAGKYKITWNCTLTFADTTTQAFSGTGQAYSFWTDLYSGVRFLLGATQSNVSDAQIETEYGNIVIVLFAFAPALPKLYLFNSDYQDYFDRAMVRFVASRLRPFLGGRRPSGEISLFKKGTSTVQYAKGFPSSIISLEDQWWNEGELILISSIPEFAAASLTDRRNDPVMTRGDLAPCNNVGLQSTYRGRYYRGRSIDCSSNFIFDENGSEM